MAYLADITTHHARGAPAHRRGGHPGWRMQADRIMAYFDARLVAENGAIAKSDLFADFTDYLGARAPAAGRQELFGTRLQRHELFRRLGLTETRKRGARGPLTAPSAPVDGAGAAARRPSGHHGHPVP
jgi:hypothetical protein